MEGCGLWTPLHWLQGKVVEKRTDFCFFYDFLPDYFCSVTGIWSLYFFLSIWQSTQSRRQHRSHTSVGLLMYALSWLRTLVFQRSGLQEPHQIGKSSKKSWRLWSTTVPCKQHYRWQWSTTGQLSDRVKVFPWVQTSLFKAWLSHSCAVQCSLLHGPGSLQNAWAFKAHLRELVIRTTEPKLVFGDLQKYDPGVPLLLAWCQREQRYNSCMQITLLSYREGETKKIKCFLYWFSAAFF